jgi:hypothetical protein
MYLSTPNFGSSFMARLADMLDDLIDAETTEEVEVATAKGDALLSEIVES